MNKITEDTKWVKCVDEAGTNGQITKDKIYEIVKIDDINQMITIKTGTRYWHYTSSSWAIDRFIPADEPKEQIMHDFKVGDKVEILSDAYFKSYNFESEIGKTGIVDKVFQNGILHVIGLPDACGCMWNYSPDQLRKVEDTPEEETQPITKDNIVEVLEYNGIDKKLYKVTKDGITCWNKNGGYGNGMSFNNDVWLKVVKAYFGELKPLPVKPQFDFIKYLLDNGAIKKNFNQLYFGDNWDNSSVHLQQYGEKWQLCAGRYIETTEENAKLIVEMAKLSERLK